MSHILDNLKFTFYIYSHPFDGFWVMKKEKTHKWQTSLVILLLFVITTEFFGVAVSACVYCGGVPLLYC